jgi:septal ring factor EnvC (AmiA/AmiB activator)
MRRALLMSQVDREMIRELIEEILAAKEDAELQESVEELLEKAKATITELSDSLEAKDSEIEKMEAKLTETSENYETAKSELDNKMSELEDLQAKLEEAQNTLAEIEKDRVANERMEKLEEAKVARTGEDRELQFTKVREMTEESFEEYAAELVSLRASLLEEMKAAQEETPEAAEEEPAGEEEVAEEDPEEAAEEEEVETPAADIDEEEAAAAALNMEVNLNEEAKKRWQAFSKAFAQNLTGKSDEEED